MLRDARSPTRTGSLSSTSTATSALHNDISRSTSRGREVSLTIASPPRRFRSFAGGEIEGKRFSHRLAAMADLPALQALMALAIRKLIGAYLDPARVEASFEMMGVDTQLIEDGTYFVIESDGQIVGCGGWSRRATMFGGDHSVEPRDAR